VAVRGQNPKRSFFLLEEILGVVDQVKGDRFILDFMNLM